MSPRIFHTSIVKKSVAAITSQCAFRNVCHEDANEISQDNSGKESDDEELRNDIASALISFKENKEVLESAKDQNPALYQATITMLRAMIDMARKLGYSPDQDLENKETANDMTEQFPSAESDEESEEDLDQELPEEESNMEEDNAEPSEEEQEEEVPIKKK